MGKFDNLDRVIADQHKRIEELNNKINLAEQGEYGSDVPEPQNDRERKYYISSLKAQRKHCEDVLIALQSGFDGADA